MTESRSDYRGNNIYPQNLVSIKIITCYRTGTYDNPIMIYIKKKSKYYAKAKAGFKIPAPFLPIVLAVTMTQKKSKLIKKKS